MPSGQMGNPLFLRRAMRSAPCTPRMRQGPADAPGERGPAPPPGALSVRAGALENAPGLWILRIFSTRTGTRFA